MDTLTLALDSAWKVLLFGLLLGAGPGPHPAGRIGAGLAFAIVLLGVALGITFVVATGFGKELSFEHIYPALVAKD